MNKAWWTKIAVLGSGAALLLAGGVYATAGTSGYDAYKAAWKQTVSVESATNEVRVTVTDNGEETFTVEALVKIDHERQRMSVEATVGGDAAEGKAHSVRVFKEGNRLIVKDDRDDVYKQMTLDEGPWDHGGERSADEVPAGPPKRAEAIADAFMGHLKQLAVVQSAADGGRTASLRLSGSQVPTVVNALASLLATHLPSDSPVWTDNVTIRHIQLDADIDPAGYLVRQTGEIAISGADASGIGHDVVIAVEFRLSGFDETVPDTVDLTGEQVELMEQTGHGPPWRHAPWHRQQ